MNWTSIWPTRRYAQRNHSNFSVHVMAKLCGIVAVYKMNRVDEIKGVFHMSFCFDPSVFVARADKQP